MMICVKLRFGKPKTIHFWPWLQKLKHGNSTTSDVFFPTFRLSQTLHFLILSDSIVTSFPLFFATFTQVSHAGHNCQCCRSVGKQDILLELAANGAFEGNRKDYFLHPTPDLSELINEEIIGESTLTSCFFLKPSSQEFFTSRILVKRKCKLIRFCRADSGQQH